MESIPPVPGYKRPRYNIDYTLKLIKIQGKWAKVFYIAIPYGGDPPGLLLEQVKGVWVVEYVERIGVIGKINCHLIINSDGL
jgi:hypothetical protein